MSTSARSGIILLGLVVIALIAVLIATRSGRISSLWLVLAGFLTLLLFPMILGLIWSLPAERCVTIFLFEIFASLLVMSLYGLFEHGDGKPDTRFREIERGTGPSHETLFVLIHGIHAGQDPWVSVRPALQPYGDVLELNYVADMLSNTDPEQLVDAMDRELQEKHEGYARVVLIGHSIGALLARKAYLNAARSAAVTQQPAWTEKVDRMVLLAGTNRGWDLSGRKPMDMSFGRRVFFWFGAWLGRLANIGRLIRAMETGAPFISDLRVEWIQWFRDKAARQPIVIQMLGDIDDVVSSEDDKDLRAIRTERFIWLKVRGTDHGEILNFDDRSGSTDSLPDGIGGYRRQKLVAAVTYSEHDLQLLNEEQPYTTDPSVNHIVFVLHGIRDLGGWSADFESQLRKELGKAASPGSGTSAGSNLAVISPRYGYFGMGQFLFRPDRQKFVRWFMDQYTETLARYPNAQRIDFIGHSNGTYLLKGAFDRYSKIQFNRVVFAGSVVPKAYDWTRLRDAQRVGKLRNYVGSTDLVVGLFPRLFETPLTAALNDMGTAGFNGFTSLPVPEPGGPEDFANVVIPGGHSAFLNVVPQIANFVMNDREPAKIEDQARPSAVLHFFSEYLFWIVWLVIIVAVVFPGVRVAVAAGTYAWIPSVIYIVLMVVLLRRL